MCKICEICGKEIKSPNYVIVCVNSLFDSYTYFAVCGLCELERLIDEYNEFKDDIDNIEFHNHQLGLINEVILNLQ